MDVRSQLALRTAEGLEAWRVAHDGKLFGDWAAAEAAGAKLPPGVFAPADAKELRKCLRVMPHHNDTGGALYFIQFWIFITNVTTMFSVLFGLCQYVSEVSSLPSWRRPAWMIWGWATTATATRMGKRQNEGSNLRGWSRRGRLKAAWRSL